MLTAGQKAPDFSVPNQDQKLVNLSDLLGKKTVLYFYPKDDTPGCTIEANDFTDLYDEFEALNTQVVGVSKDDCLSHDRFIEKYGLNVQLLSDVEGELCEAYGVWQEKEKNGEKKMGIVRSTFIIDEAGTLVDVMYGVTAKGHAQTVLDKVKALT